MNKIIRSLFVVTAIAFMAIGSSGAYFSDSVTVGPNQFSTGTWETGRGRMVINEVYYDGTDEWIELYNGGSETADIKGWSICDNDENCGSLNPAQKTEVAPGGFVIVAHSAEDLKDLTIPNTAEKVYYSAKKIAFNDTGDSVILLDKGGNVIDQMSYGNDKTIFTLPILDQEYSFERSSLGVDTDQYLDFTSRLIPTPGA